MVREDKEELNCQRCEVAHKISLVCEVENCDNIIKNINKLVKKLSTYKYVLLFVCMYNYIIFSL